MPRGGDMHGASLEEAKARTFGHGVSEAAGGGAEFTRP